MRSRSTCFPQTVAHALMRAAARLVSTPGLHVKPLLLSGSIAALLFPALFAAASGIQIVQPAISDSDGGPPNLADASYRPGDAIYFTCRIAGYSKDKDDQVRLAYTVQAVDQRNVPLAEAYKNSISADVAPQDKDWRPKIETSISLPAMVFAGEYKIVVKV